MAPRIVSCGDLRESWTDFGACEKATRIHEGSERRLAAMAAIQGND